MWDPEHPPWKSTARVLVLLRRGSDWRFAVYYAVDVADGRLDGVSPDTTPEEAQARLISMVDRARFGLMDSRAQPR
jgi:hypothetical protein